MSSTSTPDATTDTRGRIVAAAMALFGRQGFKATTIAQIEAAAGLSPGAGGLYRHFASKRELLGEGLRRQAEQGAHLLAFIANPELLARGDLRSALLAIARAGLRRLDQESDVNRLLLRDLADFPVLLEAFRQQELQRVYGVLAAWLGRQAPSEQGAVPGGSRGWSSGARVGRGAEPVDTDALAAVLISAVSHYWVLTDIFGAHPLGIDENRYLAALSDFAARALQAQ